MSYSVPPLPYDYDALEPHIDEQTMQLHHDKHHQAYVDKANAALEGTEWADKPIEEVLAEPLVAARRTSRAAVRNNGGGHANHTLFWESMSPDGGGEPDGRPRRRDRRRRSAPSTRFKEQFKAAGVGQFGSGWAWLVHDGGGARSRPRPPTRTTRSRDGQTPLLGIDVWEHAYYLKYQNRRPDYLDAWWNVVNWDRVAERYAAAKPVRAGSTA